MFHSSRIIITIGSLIVPALLSIQGPSNTDISVYWITWVVSLLVTICNALVTLFKFDKRYYYLHTVLEQFISEGWQYIELTGKYSGFNTPKMIPTHDNQFVYFCHAIEKIRMKQVEEEYYKIHDSQAQNTPVQDISKASFIPPTPQQHDLVAIPTEIITAVRDEIAKSVSPPIVGHEDATENQKNSEDGAATSVSVSFNM